MRGHRMMLSLSAGVQALPQTVNIHTFVIRIHSSTQSLKEESLSELSSMAFSVAPLGTGASGFLGTKMAGGDLKIFPTEDKLTNRESGSLFSTVANKPARSACLTGPCGTLRPARRLCTPVPRN